MNASKYGCDALIVLAIKDPVHIPVLKQDILELTLRLRTLTRGVKKMVMMDIEKEFKIFLRELWDELVSHIVIVLQTTCDHNSHIWWCPTAEFALFPLHAAAPYREGEKGLSSLYVSSYTPPSYMLDDLAYRTVQLGRNVLSRSARTQANLFTWVPSWTTFMRIEGEDACISNVADKLGKHEWVHFACHGIPSQEKPFESAFALHDGPCTIQHIIQCNLQNPVFAYLSACHTTVGDQESPDEVIHLSAAMQFAGFRSVIGTMSAVDDSQTNEVISVFYKFMVDDSGHLNYARAAHALRMTKRKVDIPMDSAYSLYTSRCLTFISSSFIGTRFIPCSAFFNREKGSF